jgi:prepilin-type N-terminal cleavage/methylation domain-containing protein
MTLIGRKKNNLAPSGDVLIQIKSGAGFTLMELLVTIAIFAILTAGVLGTIAATAKAVKMSREKTILSSLSNYYLEVVRNMPYSQVGTLQGNPHGSLPDQPNSISQVINGTTYKIYYEVNYYHDPADTSVGTADYKMVKMSILNSASGQITDFQTTVVPQGVISNPNTGALQVNVINAQGQPLIGANVNITYPPTPPYTYNLPDVTNQSGQVLEVGLPGAVNSYRISATEPGFSTDSTTPITVQNPNPVHPDATVASGTITQLTLSIDQLANLNIKTLSSTCQPLNGVNLNVSGAKLIGTSPNVIKFNNNYSSSAGAIPLNNIEWDTYTPTLLTGQSVITYGTSPVQQITVLPNTSQTFTMILGSNATANSLLVIVKDASSSTALENASVTLTDGGSYTQTLLTGGSVWLQNNWAGGSGQALWSSSTPSMYFQDNGNVNVSTAGQVTLKKIGNSYTNATGTLVSSAFDTGTNATNYTILSWAPASQSASTTVVFQVAANNDDATWNYVGPDDTANTYFTSPGQDMGSILDNNEFFRYKVFLSTANTTKTPTLTSVNVNFVTGCFTPGQVIFTGLSNKKYYVTVSMSGYQTQSNLPVTVNGNQPFQVLMSP